MKTQLDTKPRNLKDVFDTQCQYVMPHQPIDLSDTEKAITVISRNNPNGQESVILHEPEVK
jgi:uncharacterized RmlC-like cupin family protein